jgi:hypothetical protein
MNPDEIKKIGGVWSLVARVSVHRVACNRNKLYVDMSATNHSMFAVESLQDFCTAECWSNNYIKTRVLARHQVLGE